jgi:hypothetical protein
MGKKSAYVNSFAGNPPHADIAAGGQFFVPWMRVLTQHSFAVIHDGYALKRERPNTYLHSFDHGGVEVDRGAPRN